MDLTILPFTEDRLRSLIREELQHLLALFRTEPSSVAYLTMAQAMARYECKKSLLHRISSDRAVTTRKIGKNIQFDAQELEDYFNGKMKKSASAIEKDLEDKPLFPTLSQARKRKPF